MSKKELYCVHDKKSNTYDGFMLFNNSAEAIRAFQMSCEKNEVFRKWPEDFQFVKILEIKYNESGFLTDGHKNETVVIAEAKDFIKPAEQQPVEKKQ